VFEKERKINYIMMAAGAASAAAGAAVYFLTSHHMIGISLMIAGAAVLVITFSISNVFFRIDMMEMMEKRRDRR
jgi:hypothetical protein